MNEKTIKSNGIEVDGKKVQNMLRKLIIKERTNLKTKEKNDGQMVREIKKMLEEDVECY